ncbi:MAG TPA: helix-turn-helix transcriptional regulator [Actinophytocola sp.]|uniref:helix-turn-helix domain-containing protein n=1 Tax=Actinophytocola sp. TaxID=1872138 RepID=UPI002DDD43A0|nr:helix-turn-helix transcriptional regulator [Actinophytocola sp.]HEV2784083.1 helix-turn-helix transcriptional regulator [Actinophytocola sp.]
MARTARRLLASRLRALRETGFDVKVTQDQLAAALGAGKPLSSAAISTWENSEIDKWPSPTRLVQYALIFSGPKSLVPALHVPDESTLDKPARIRFHQLRSGLLELRESAEREAKRERTHPAPAGGHELWHHDRAEKLFVVAPELPPGERMPYADERNVNYIRLARYGDLDAFFEMFVSLTRMGYTNLSHRSAREHGIGTARNLVLIGGPTWNPLTRSFMHLLNLPVEQHPAAGGEAGYFTASDGTAVVPSVLGESQVVEDIGLFVRATNPTNPDTDVTICTGVYTYGVLGAVHLFTNPRLAGENVRAVQERLGQARAFAVLFRVKVIDGRVPTPRLPAAIIDCVPLD